VRCSDPRLRGKERGTKKSVGAEKDREKEGGKSSVAELQIAEKIQ
jgi:hypothetical protein